VCRNLILSGTSNLSRDLIVIEQLQWSVFHPRNDHSSENLGVHLEVAAVGLSFLTRGELMFLTMVEESLPQHLEPSELGTKT
jgi:hypothetical protein